MYLVDAEGSGATRPPDREPRGMRAWIEQQFGPMGATQPADRKAQGQHSGGEGGSIRSRSVCEYCGRRPIGAIFQRENGVCPDDVVGLCDACLRLFCQELAKGGRIRTRSVCEYCGRHPIRAVLHPEGRFPTYCLLGVCEACRRLVCPDPDEEGCGVRVI